MVELTQKQIRHLKGLAQRLEPVLKVGHAGLSPAFLKSLDEALGCHELVKVKFTDFKERKKELSIELAEKSGARLVTRVGNVAVLFRQNADAEKRKVRV